MTKVETSDLATVKSTKEIIERINLEGELPGLKVQLMAAPPYRPMDISREELQSARRAAVMLLMVPSDMEGWELVFILRAPYDGVHSNQVGFPGGEVEDGDVDLLGTALRECEEEVGVEVKRDDVIGGLTELYIPPSNFMVKPYVAVVSKRPQFIPETSEVAEILTMDIEELLAGDVWSKYKVRSGSVPGFEVQGNLVWGATAMIIAEFVECCGAKMPEIPLHHE